MGAKIRGAPHQIVVADRAIGSGKFATRGGPVGNQKSKLPSLLWVLFNGRVAGARAKRDRGGGAEFGK